jgi:Na+/H+ antiporter NhaB
MNNFTKKTPDMLVWSMAGVTASAALDKLGVVARFDRLNPFVHFVASMLPVAAIGVLIGAASVSLVQFGRSYFVGNKAAGDTSEVTEEPDDIDKAGQTHKYLEMITSDKACSVAFSAGLLFHMSRIGAISGISTGVMAVAASVAAVAMLEEQQASGRAS